MTDQRLPLLGDDGDADERAFLAMSAFKDKVREFVKETGLSGNALGKKLGLPDGKVSLWSNPSRDQAHLPRLDFVEALLREAQERGNVRDGAAEAFVREYGEMLQVYCARKKPHSMHVAMLAEYKFTMVIREMTASMNDVRSQELGVRAEMEALREDRNGQRERRQALQRQLEELSQEHARLATDRQTAVVRRDQAQTDLAVYETAKDLVVAPKGGGLGAQGQTGPEQASSHANHPATPALPEAEADPMVYVARRVKRAGALVAPGVVLCLAAYGAFALFGGDGKDDAKGGQTGGQTSAASSTPQAQAPSPTPPGTAPASPSKPPAAAVPHPNEPLPLILTEPPCDSVAEIDFDQVPLSKWVSTQDLAGEYAPQESTDMTWGGCAAAESWKTMPDAHAGIVRQGVEVTADSCRAAANGGGLEHYRMRSGNPGFVKGATLYAISDKGRLVAAKVVAVNTLEWSFSFDVRTIS